MVTGMTEEIPDEYFDGIAAIEAVPAARRDPRRNETLVLGECIPLESGDGLQLSRIVLYHGSFQALAQDDPSFDWREEAWETLWHEVRHHIEWRAGSAALEDYDWAAEQNHARRDGDPFDAVFYRAGERLEERVYRVEDDVFVEIPVSEPHPAEVRWEWRGVSYGVAMPMGTLPLFVTVDGLPVGEPGDVVLVLRRRPRMLDLFRRPAPPVSVHAEAHRAR